MIRTKQFFHEKCFFCCLCTYMYTFDTVVGNSEIATIPNPGFSAASGHFLLGYKLDFRFWGLAIGVSCLTIGVFTEDLNTMHRIAKH